MSEHIAFVVVYEKQPTSEEIAGLKRMIEEDWQGVELVEDVTHVEKVYVDEDYADKEAFRD